ncbi:BnaA10g05510D [Brassica napus]|uniref:BnaA10g05510D protein n=1 Tax=Brassica napus TaxID=3708 RepID=A0A078HHE1_BRANA|nr:BnaA10g05510D [Brassica napus]
MLKKRTVKDSCIRVKYALLALLAAVILPTTHTPRISQDHTELIKDIDDFFAYPWGRVSFDMLMSSIKERKEVSLSQNTIALKGFVLSLQLVMVEAIPALTEVVNDGSSSGSKSDGCEEDDLVDEDKNGKRSLSPGHARAIDAAGEVAVHSIIVEDKEHFKASPDLGWSDDEEDPIVDNLMSLLEQQFPFNKSSFTGGVTKLEVNRMREGAKIEAINRKTVKPKQTKQTTTSEVIDVESVASIVRDKVSSGQIPVSSSAQTENISNVARDGQHRDIRRTSPHCVGIHTESAQNDIINDAIRFANQTTSLPVDVRASMCENDVDHSQSSPDTVRTTLFQAERPHWKETVTEGASMCENDVDHSQSSPDTNLDHELPFPKPTFSLGLTQEERPHQKEAATEEICEQDDQLGACRKSKRLKALPKSLVGQYECDMRLLNRARVAFVDPDNTGGNIDYAAKFSSLLDKLKTPFTIRIGQSTLESNDLNELVQRSSPLPPKVVDVLIGHISSQFTLNSPPNQSNHPVFMDTQFVSQLSKLFTKFSKMSKKESFWFPSHILERVRTLRTDSMMVKEVTPIAQMFPYLLKQGGKQLLHKDARAFPIERPRSIPQNTSHADSAVSALLLVQAHAVAGVDVCKCITPDKIGSEVETLAVMFYEATVGML